MCRQVLVLAVLVTLACSDTGELVAPEPPAILAKAFHEASNTIHDAQNLIFVPCVAGGIGEYVLIEGRLHVLTSWTSAPSGHLQISRTISRKTCAARAGLPAIPTRGSSNRDLSSSWGGVRLMVGSTTSG